MIDPESRNELENLLLSYCYSLDRRDYATLKGLYHDGAIDDHGDYKGDVDGLIAWLSEVQDGLESSSHTLVNMRFAREGDYAESEARGITYLCIKGTPARNVMVVGRHFDRYERRDGRWGFTHRALCVDWVQLMPHVDSEFDLTGSVEPGKPGPDDPFYSRLRLLPKLPERS